MQGLVLRFDGSLEILRFDMEPHIARPVKKDHNLYTEPFWRGQG